MPYLDLDNLDHDPDLAIALGNMMIAWARAETALVQVFSFISGMHFNLTSVAYYRIPTFEARTKVILAMIREWQADQASRERYALAVSKLSKLASTRNHWIHGIWGYDEDTKTTVTFDLRGSGPAKPVKANDVRHHVTTVRQRTADLEKMVPLNVLKFEATP
jgi:hypothetical protein